MIKLLARLSNQLDGSLSESGLRFTVRKGGDEYQCLLPALELAFYCGTGRNPHQSREIDLIRTLKDIHRIVLIDSLMDIEFATSGAMVPITLMGYRKALGFPMRIDLGEEILQNPFRRVASFEVDRSETILGLLASGLGGSISEQGLSFITHHVGQEYYCVVPSFELAILTNHLDIRQLRDSSTIDLAARELWAELTFAFRHIISQSATQMSTVYTLNWVRTNLGFPMYAKA